MSSWRVGEVIVFLDSPVLPPVRAGLWQAYSVLDQMLSILCANCRWLEEAADKPPAHVVVNLAGVKFVDSTALAALVRSMKRCRQQGGDLHLCGLQQPVRIIFELTRLDRAIEI